jgi:hypothetical protein
MFNAAQEGRIWMCWACGPRTWLFTGELSRPALPDRQTAVLHVNVYREDGELIKAGAWAPDTEGKLQH